MSDSASSSDGERTSSDEESSEPTLVCDDRIAFKVDVEESVTNDDNVVAENSRILVTREELGALSKNSEMNKALEKTKKNDNTATWIKESENGVSTTQKEYEVVKPEVSKEKSEQLSIIVSESEKNPATGVIFGMESDGSLVAVESTGKETSVKGVDSWTESTTREAKILVLNKLENRLGSHQMRFATHEKALMRNFKILMQDVILDEGKANVFLAFLKKWLEKRLTRRGRITKEHAEIKAIRSKLQKKRNRVEETISNLRNIWTEMTKTVIGADALLTINQHTVSNLYTKMIVLWNEFTAISSWPSHQRKETEKAVKEQIVWCEKHVQLGNNLGKLEDEYSKFANLVKYVKEEIATLNKSLKSEEKMVIKDMRSPSNNEKLRQEYEDGQEFFRKKLKVCADERFDVITLQEEMSEEFDNLNIQNDQNFNSTEKIDLQQDILAKEASKLNNLYLKRLVKQVSAMEYDKLTIQSGEFDISDDNKGKLILRLKQSKQSLEDIIIQVSENQKAIDKLWDKLRSSPKNEKNLSHSTDVSFKKVTLNDQTLLRGKILSLESDRRKIIALSRKLGEENNSLYGELIELGLVKKSLDTEQQYEPTTTLMNDKLAKALTELELASGEIKTLHNDSSKLLDRCTEMINKDKNVVDRGNDNRNAIRKYEAEIKVADMEEMKRLSVLAFDEIKFELLKYHRAVCNLNFLKKINCQTRKPRLKVNAPYVNPEEKFSDLKNLLIKSQQTIEKLIENCLHQLTVSKSEVERLKVWVRENEIKNIGICELEPKFSSLDVEPKTGMKRLVTQPKRSEHIKVLQKMPNEKDDLTLRDEPKMSDGQVGNNRVMELKLVNEKSLLLANLKQQIEVICSKRRNFPTMPVEKVQDLESKVKSFELEIRDQK